MICKDHCDIAQQDGDYNKTDKHEASAEQLTTSLCYQGRDRASAVCSFVT